MAEWDYELFWNETLNQIREELGEEEFSRWFKLVDYLRGTEQEITLGVPSGFYRDQVKNRYQSRIEAVLKLVIGREILLRFEVISQSQRPAAPPQAAAPVPQPAVSPPQQPDLSPQQPTLSPPKPVTPAGKPEPARAQPHLFPASSIPESKAKKSRHTLLREDYTFDKYIIGDNNNFAANAALAISRNPGTSYNPFLIYGGVGLGKTHLMQAIGNHVHQSSERKIIYITAENFTNEFIQAIREERMPAFKNKYRFVDMLLIDDIHFLENKWETQEELFHTFNALYDANKHIIFTCDRPASELKKISERLRSRFERGLNVDLHPPNYETRCAILKSKIQDRKVVISDEILALIARNISTNVRDLEAALTKLTAYAELLGKPITLESAQQQLRDVFASPVKQTPLSIPVETILHIVADYFSLPLNDLKSNKRTQKIAQPRQITMYIAREITEFSITEIGQQFGGRHYTTVMHACEKIKDQCRSDPSLEATIQTIIGLVKAAATQQPRS